MKLIISAIKNQIKTVWQPVQHVFSKFVTLNFDWQQLGMGSALETLCGQAYGAGRLRMLGVYMQRSWIILLTCAVLLTPIYFWSPPILEVVGETTEISEAAGQRFQENDFALYITNNKIC